MRLTSGRPGFLLLALVGAILLALGIYQVPQPWRALLVAWVLVGVTLGALILRLVRHHYEFIARRGTRNAAPHRSATLREPRSPGFEGLKIIVASDGGRRYTIR